MSRSTTNYRPKGVREILWFLLTVSRYRFWVYLWGTYIIGYTAGVDNVYELFDTSFLITLFYFTLPANFIIYAVNDKFDQLTDRFNNKKNGKEYKGISNVTIIDTYLIIFILLSIIITFIQPTLISSLFLVLFISVGIMYSSPPFRFKKIPFIDFLSNIFYIFPIVVGYFSNQHSISSVPLSLVFGAMAWVFAMHIFSAVPDIKADKKAGITTTPVVLGRMKSLFLCFLLWGFFAYSFQLTSLFPLVKYLFYLYPAIVLIVILQKSSNNDNMFYWKYPYVNFICGFLLFVNILYTVLY